MALWGFWRSRMATLKHSCALIILLTYLSCAAQDQSTLYIFNNSAPGFGSTVTVLESKKRIADVKRQRYVVLQIAAGHHVLRRPVQSKKSHVELDAVPGETYYLVGGAYPRMTPKEAQLFGSTALVEITKADADQLLARMKPQDDE